MKRRSFFAATFLLLSIVFAGIAAHWIRTGDSAGYGYAIVAVIHLAMAGGYQMHPVPLDDPDDPAPREWLELAGLIAVVLLGSALLLFVVVG